MNPTIKFLFILVFFVSLPSAMNSAIEGEAKRPSRGLFKRIFKSPKSLPSQTFHSLLQDPDFRTWETTHLQENDRLTPKERSVWAHFYTAFPSPHDRETAFECFKNKTFSLSPKYHAQLISLFTHVPLSQSEKNLISHAILNRQHQLWHTLYQEGNENDEDERNAVYGEIIESAYKIYVLNTKNFGFYTKNPQSYAQNVAAFFDRT